MKSKKSRPGENPATTEIETPANNPHLKHLLSPLELAVFKHDFKQFNYEMDGEQITIESGIAKEINFISRKHVRMLRALLQRARQKDLRVDPAVKLFLNMPLKNHNLPTRIYHVLHGNCCANMADVANRGEYELKRMRHMGRESIKYLVKLFNDNGCGNLFL